VDDSERILIIDDEQIVLDSCRRILRGTDYELKTASNGNQGLKLVEEFEPDLVFVDLKMPGVSGFDVLERIRETDPTVVTIVITGYATVSSAVEAMKKGAYDFLPKPFTPDEYRLITMRGLEKRRLVLETIALRHEKEVLREHFAAIVSHELKSPLGAVQQNLYLLVKSLEDRLTDKEAERLERMRVRIDDLMKLIHTWLRVVSVDVTDIEESFTAVDVATVVEKAVESVEPQAVRKDVTLRWSVADDAGQVLGDEVTLVEGVVNILGNAVRYSHMGSEVVVLGVRDGGDVVITVTDQGVGIDAEDLPFVFEDFFRGTSGKAKAKGSGIGLGITRRIMEAHHGTIDVESELGEGSTFRMRLPALRNEAAAGGSSAGTADADSGGAS
jgi:signal transduction histidine kinase